MLQQTGPDPWIDALFLLQLLGNITYVSGDMDLAEASARTMQQQHSQYAGCHWLLAKVFTKQDKTGEAKQSCKRHRKSITTAMKTESACW